MPHDPLILVVEDYPDAREMYRTYLTFKGYRVVVASSGQESVDVARTQKPALILMDVRMPGITAIEAMHRIRSDSTLSNVPIVALTAYTLEDELATRRAAGFDDVITKPCDLDDLGRAVERLLSRAGEGQ